MAVKPLDDRVLVKQSEAEERTAGGIVLPDTAKEKPQKGVVIAVGVGKLLDSGVRSKMTLKKGDEVFYGKYSGTEIKIDGDEYVILKESDVLAVEIQDTPGSLHRIVEVLDSRGVNVEYLYTFFGKKGNNVLVVFKADNAPGAAGALSAAGIPLLSEDVIRKL